MQVLRTILWVLVTALLVAFVAMNWTRAPVNLWPLDDGNYVHFEWPVGIVAILFFLLGMAPMWLFHRANRWRMTRRIANLESSVRAVSVPGEPAAATPAVAPPAPTAAEPATHPVSLEKLPENP